MSDFEIKPASEVPDKSIRRGPKSRYPFEDMKVGTAVYLPVDPIRGNPVNAAHQYGRLHGWKFRTSKQIDGSVRIERVK